MPGILSTQEDCRLPSPVLAKEVLEKLVAVTAKACERNNLTVLRLEEFYPQNRSLLVLNINAGEKIKIRLREGHDPREFLPWSSILGTMVHELTHNLVGSHSAEFYEEMERLQSEVDIDRVSEANTFNPYRNQRKQYNFEGPYHVLGTGDQRSLSSRWTDFKYCLPSEDIFLRPAGTDEYKQSNVVDGSCSIVSSKNLTNFNTATSSHAEIVPVSWKCNICTELNDASEFMASNRKINAQEQIVLIYACLFCGCSYGSTLNNETDALSSSWISNSQQSVNRKRACLIDLTLDNDASTEYASHNHHSRVVKPVENVDEACDVALKRRNEIDSSETGNVNKKTRTDRASSYNRMKCIDLTQ